MLTRVVTAVCVIAVVIIVLLLSNTVLFNIAISVVCAIMIRELFKAEKCLEFKSSYFICMAYVIAMPFFSIPVLSKFQYAFSALCAMLLFTSYLAQHKTMNFDKLAFMITTGFLISTSMNCFIYIKNSGKENGIFFIILVLCGAWVGDAGAYFVGTFLGKHKLVPEISPKKTVEGAVGGVIITGITFLLLALGYDKLFLKDIEISTLNYVLITVVGMACSVLGMIGDLSASLLKRQCQIKDYGNLMPGHGGMVDRFDSVLFVAPFISILLSIYNFVK
ncbi:MAG: phosphatidate cytidylyltransferase [Oscillospiraceae bacterium]